MAKLVNDEVLDAAFDVIHDANLQIICSGQPVTRAQALSLALADTPMTPIADYVKGPGDISGRKATVVAKNNVVVDNAGTATHLALVNDTDLLYVTTCTNQPLVALNTVNIPAWDIEIADPV